MTENVIYYDRVITGNEGVGAAVQSKYKILQCTYDLNRFSFSYLHHFLLGDRLDFAP